MPESDTSSVQRKSKYEWVLCSENWQDFVIIHKPQLNITPVATNYANLSIKEIKIPISNIIATGDHARKDQNRAILLNRPVLEPFSFLLFAETHGLEIRCHLINIFCENSY